MASSTTVRINQNVLDMLKEIATKDNSNVQATLERAVEEYRRQIMFKEANAAYQNLKLAGEWKDELEEREIWDIALLDDDQ